VVDPQRLVRRVAGGYRLSLSPQERDLLRAIGERLDARIAAGGPDTRRLHPPAFPDDPGAQASYEEATRESLTDLRAARLEVFNASIDRDRLDPRQADAWLGVLNDARLVLGTALDVTEEDEEDIATWDLEGPDGFDRLCYLYAGMLVAQLVDALASALPDR
jgi:hypothetical protein